MKISILLLLVFFSMMLMAQQDQEVIVNQEAQFPGGNEALIKYLWQNIKPTEQSTGQVVIGEVLISIDVLPDSSIANAVFMKKIGYGLDEQILNILKTTKFIPSIQNNTAVKMNMVLSIPIQLIPN